MDKTDRLISMSRFSEGTSWDGLYNCERCGKRVEEISEDFQEKSICLDCAVEIKLAQDYN